MTFVINRKLDPPAVPVHVLIVVVGKYLSQADDLPGAGAFAQEIVEFWKSGTRIFPDQQLLASIRVLASDPVGGQVRIVGDEDHNADLPTYAEVRDALLTWSEQIKNGGAGFLHWVGHGVSRLQAGGSITNLFCHGSRNTDSSTQDGLDWTRSLKVIDQMTVGRPVYCFIDACRRRDRSENLFDGIGSCDLKIDESAYVFASTRLRKPAFWVTQPNTAAQRAGCGGGALGTRAFMAALDGLGARYDRLPMPIGPSQLVEAAQALVKRWAKHQGMQPGVPEGPVGADATRSILLTKTPGSVVDVIASGSTTRTLCEAQPVDADVVTAAENGPAPFEFRLARKPHRFRFDDEAWHEQQDLWHPYHECGRKRS